MIVFLLRFLFKKEKLAKKIWRCPVFFYSLGIVPYSSNLLVPAGRVVKNSTDASMNNEKSANAPEFVSGSTT
jgi:hypothetical protein